MYSCNGNYTVDSDYDDIGIPDKWGNPQACNISWDDGKGREGSPLNRTLLNATDAFVELQDGTVVPLDAFFENGVMVIAGLTALGLVRVCVVESCLALSRWRKRRMDKYLLHARHGRTIREVIEDDEREQEDGMTDEQRKQIKALKMII